MSEYFLKIILLEGCPYSIKVNNIRSDRIHVTPSKKYKYKTKQIDTFPQIYLNDKNSKKSLLFGGHNDFVEFVKNITSKNISLTKQMIYRGWSTEDLNILIDLVKQ